MSDTESTENTEVTTRQWGGARENSGRKPTLHNPVKKMVRLEESQMAHIIEWCEERNINVNAAIREMIQFAHQHKTEVFDYEDIEPDPDPSDAIVPDTEPELEDEADDETEVPF